MKNTTLLKTGEVAEILRVDVKTVRCLLHSGALSGYKFGYRTMRIDKDSVDRFMEAHRPPVGDVNQKAVETGRCEPIPALMG